MPLTLSAMIPLHSFRCGDEGEAHDLKDSAAMFGTDATLRLTELNGESYD